MNETLRARAFQLCETNGVDWVLKQISKDMSLASDAMAKENERRMAAIRIGYWQQWMLEKSFELLEQL